MVLEEIQSKKSVVFENLTLAAENKMAEFDYDLQVKNPLECLQMMLEYSRESIAGLRPESEIRKAIS